MYSKAKLHSLRKHFCVLLGSGSSLHLYPPVMVLLLCLSLLFPGGPRAASDMDVTWATLRAAHKYACHCCISFGELEEDGWVGPAGSAGVPLCAWSGWMPLPRSYSCQHTFCKRCLLGIVGSRNELRCPECRTLVGSGVEKPEQHPAGQTSGRHQAAAVEAWPVGAVAPTAPAPWGLRVVLWSPAALKMAQARRVDPKLRAQAWAPCEVRACGGRCLQHVFFILWCFLHQLMAERSHIIGTDRKLWVRIVFLFWNAIGCK